MRNDYQSVMPMASQEVRPREPAPSARWLVWFHRVPPRPHYLRVKVGRQLRRLGAVALKNTVYVLPASAVHRAELARIAAEVLERGGEAVACEARLVGGIADPAIEDRFREARDREYARIAERAARLAGSLAGRSGRAENRRRQVARDLERLQKSFAEVVARDPFGAGGRESAASALSLVEDLLEGVEVAGGGTSPGQPPRGATWVTRSGVMVDRIASAWLIRRFIDRSARFRFVPARAHRIARGEIRFDMAGGEFTHRDGRCTFEVLLESFRLRDSGLQRIGEIVHDLDLRDDRFRHPETSGVGRTLVGMALVTPDDASRLERGAAILDGLHQSFRGRRAS